MTMKKKVLILILMTFVIGLFTGCVSTGVEDLETDNFDKSKAEVQQNLSNLGKEKGYEITYHFEDLENGESITCTIGVNDKYTWYYINDFENGFALEQVDDLIAYYSLRNKEWEYEYAYIDDGTYSHDLSSQFALFFNVYELDGKMKKSGTGVIAGRKCDIYKFSFAKQNAIVGAVSGVDINWEYWLDQKTGLCLKYFVEESDKESSSKLKFEVTSFKENATVTLNRPLDIFPINGKDPNETGEWNLLSFIGLNILLPAQEQLLESDIYYSIESLGIGLAQYYFKLDDITSLEEGIEYISNLYPTAVEEIKRIADDKKCYIQSYDELIEAEDELEEESTECNFVFNYNNQLYELHFFVDESIDPNYSGFLLDVRFNASNN